MEFMQILANECDANLLTILGVVKWAINLICWIIPIILIVLTVIDLFKAVTSNDEKKTKEVQKQVITRVVYAIVIFLVPYIITLLFNILPSAITKNATIGGQPWLECWNEAKA